MIHFRKKGGGRRFMNNWDQTRAEEMSVFLMKNSNPEP